MKNFIRGGQVFAHSFRMARQVLRIAFFLSLFISLVWMVRYAVKVDYFLDLYTVGTGLFGKGMMSFADVLSPRHFSRISYYNFELGRWQTYLATVFVKSPLYHSAFANIMDYTPILIRGMGGFIGTFLSVILYFVVRGAGKFKKETLRGGSLSSSKDLKQLLKKDKKTSSIMIGDIPMVKDTETQHVMLCGTSGSGKTTWMHHLMPQIQKKKQKTIIVDVVGSFVDRYYREGYDVLLNPYDARTAYWTPWADIKGEGSIDAITTAMTSTVSTSGTSAGEFFDKTSSILLKSLLQKLSEEGTLKNEALYNLIATSPSEKLEGYLRGTPGQLLVNPKGKETTLSIRATLLSKLEGLSKLKDKEERPFSIRDFVEEESDRNLFISLPRADHLEGAKNLAATWINVAILALMNQREDFDRRVWFLIDELPSLGRIPALVDAVTRIRKYGGCMVATMQTISQLDQVYGYHDKETLLGNFNTKVAFRATDIKTAEYYAKLMGQREHRRMQENISYGAHQMRDGVSFNETERLDQIILPSEIMGLPERACYVRLPGSYPIAKTTISIKETKPITQAYVESGA